MKQLKRVRCLSGRCSHHNAKKGPEIDHEPHRDNPISKKHDHLMGLATLCDNEWRMLDQDRLIKDVLGRADDRSTVYWWR